MKLRTLLILFLAAVLLFASVPAFAAEEPAAEDTAEAAAEQEAQSGEGVWPVINALLALAFIASIFFVGKIAEKKRPAAKSDPKGQ